MRGRHPHGFAREGGRAFAEALAKQAAQVPGPELRLQQDRPQVCMWFRDCANAAAGTVTHPILGEVPTCQRCATKLDLELKLYA
jgi:hypothetical protein